MKFYSLCILCLFTTSTHIKAIKGILTAQPTIDAIDKVIKGRSMDDSSFEPVSVAKILETIQEFLTDSTDETKEIIRQALLDRYANKVFAQIRYNYTQYYDGRVLSLADRLNTPDRLIESPWRTFSIEELVRHYYIVHDARKKYQPHPFIKATLTYYTPSVPELSAD